MENHLATEKAGERDSDSKAECSTVEEFEEADRWWNGDRQGRSW